MSYEIEQIARVTHEANRAIQYLNGEVIAAEWDLASDYMRNSVMEGVKKALGGSNPEQLHEEWVKMRVNDGWKWGPIKSERDKTHPQLVPYAELPADQRLKDVVFQGIVKAFDSVG